MIIRLNKINIYCLTFILLFSVNAIVYAYSQDAVTNSMQIIENTAIYEVSENSSICGGKLGAPYSSQTQNKCIIEKCAYVRTSDNNYYCRYPKCEDFAERTGSTSASKNCPKQINIVYNNNGVRRTIYSITCKTQKTIQGYDCISGATGSNGAISSNYYPPNLDPNPSVHKEKKCSDYNGNQSGCESFTIMNGFTLQTACTYDNNTKKCNGLSSDVGFDSYACNCNRNGYGNTAYINCMKACDSVSKPSIDLINRCDNSCAAYAKEKHGTPSGGQASQIYQQTYNKCYNECTNSSLSYTPGGGGGSKGGKCTDTINYVANVIGLTCNPPVNNSIENANCSKYITNNYDPDVSSKMSDKKYYVILTNAKVNGKIEDYKNRRYAGNCNGYRTNVFCIEPTYAYNPTDYIVKASLNADGEYDIPYIRIYQSVLKKAYAYNSFKNENMTSQVYEVIHLAYRLYSYYNNSLNGRYKGNIPSAEYLIDAFANSSKAINSTQSGYKYYNKHAYRSYLGNTYYLFDALDSALNLTSQQNTTNYQSSSSSNNDTIGGGGTVLDQALELFLDGINDNIAIWDVPVKANKISDDGDNVVTVSLSGFMGFKGSPTNDSKVLSLSCDNCVFTSHGNVSSINLHDDGLAILNNNIDELIVTLKYTTKDYKINLEYFDRRSPQNVLISYNRTDPNNNQKEPVITEEWRPLIYSFEFDSANKTCSISGGIAYDLNGSQTTAENFADKGVCCDALRTSATLRSKFHSLGHPSYMTDSWIQNGCKKTCEPNANNPEECKIDSNYGDTQVVTYSELTKKSDTDSKRTEGYNYQCLMSESSNYTYEINTTYSAYCSLGCSQEYTFNMPTKLYANTGRYINLSIPASTEKTCVTNKINHSEFNKNYNERKTSLDAAVNDYNKWVDIKASVKDSDISNTGSTTCTFQSEENSSCPSYSSLGSDGLCHHSKKKKENCNDGSWTASASGTDCTKSPGKQNVTKNCTGENASGSNYSITLDGVVFNSNTTCNGCSATSGTYNNLKEQINSYVEQKKSIVDGALNNLNAAINAYNMCFEPNGNLVFDPIVKFDYEEDYYMNLFGANAQLTSTGYSPSSSVKHYNASGILDDGNGLYFKNATSNQKDVLKSTYRYDGNKYVYDTTKVYRSTTDYSEVKINASTTLTSKTNWYTSAGNGKASTNQSLVNKMNIGNVLPVSNIKSGLLKDTFNYALTVTNIGRLDEYFSKIEREKLSYSCNYDLYCKPPCRTCEPGYFYREISLNDVFTKTTNDISPKQNLTNSRTIVGIWASEKGKTTQTEIEALGENTYKDENLDYSYTLTPAGMKQIREYNKATNYGDFNLVCDDGLDCKSSFLDSIKKNEIPGVIENKRNNEFIHFNGTSWK